MPIKIAGNKMCNNKRIGKGERKHPNAGDAPSVPGNASLLYFITKESSKVPKLAGNSTCAEKTTQLSASGSTVTHPAALSDPPPTKMSSMHSSLFVRVTRSSRGVVYGVLMRGSLGTSFGNAPIRRQ